jgi:hypothetical protein
MAMASRLNYTSTGRCNRRPDSIILLGDNFYEGGLASTKDPLFQEYFVQNFVANGAFEGISFSVIAGNHG